MDGICKEYVWNMYGTCMEWTEQHGICMDQHGIGIGICMEYGWNRCGICENMYGIRTEQAWNMYGTWRRHGIGIALKRYGICMEHGWNRCGMYMEYVWNVYELCAEYV